MKPKYLYSAKTCAFYSADLGNAPDGCVEVSQADFDLLTAGRNNGKVIELSGGKLMLVDRVETAEELASAERAVRDGELLSVEWLRNRHRDQLDIGVDTTLTPAQFKELLVYLQALRDWPQSEHFPKIEHRPVAPPWIAEQTQ